MGLFYFVFGWFGFFFNKREIKTKHPRTEPQAKALRSPWRSAPLPRCQQQQLTRQSQGFTWGPVPRAGRRTLESLLLLLLRRGNTGAQQCRGSEKPPVWRRFPGLGACTDRWPSAPSPAEDTGFCQEADIYRPVAVIYNHPCFGWTSPPAASAFFFCLFGLVFFFCFGTVTLGAPGIANDENTANLPG